MRQKYSPILILVAFACAQDQPGSQTTMPAGAVVSLRGDTLTPIPMSEELTRTRQEHLDDARAAYESAPTNADSIIWYGRRLAYMGDYQEAIGVYTDGIAEHPNDARMYRHRGHRYITSRQLDAAQQDFEKAAALTAGQPDQVEPDGLPNALNIPTSTLQSNIWYHLGLARYLRGDFSGAREAYKSAMDVSTNDDMLVATAYWYYMTLARLDMENEAEAVLQLVTDDMDIIENQSYQKLLLLFKGELDVDDVLDLSNQDDVALASATVTYGVGQWHALNGRMGEARQMWEQTVNGTQWGAFGYIAAEAELARDDTASS